MVEESAPRPRAEPRTFRLPTDSSGEPRALSQVDASDAERIVTGIGELDRVLGGGLVPGSLSLIGGPPGIGKSTLVLQMAQRLAGASAVLYATAEESLAQLGGRARRLGASPPRLAAVCESSVLRIVEMATSTDYVAVVVDSIQAMFDPALESAPGSVSQVRESAARLMHAAKSSGVAVVMVGHVTKDGGLAGPRVLEHLVDVVLELEASVGQGHRILRSRKNRFGSTQELGVFEMAGDGLREVSSPSELFLTHRTGSTPGAVVTATLEGSRPMLVEVQALVADTSMGPPRRACSGFDSSRTALLLAVLDRRAGQPMLGSDVFVNMAGGLAVEERGADLAVCLALASSRNDWALPSDLVAFGEVGLGGELRAVPQAGLRCGEAQRLGFRRVMMPKTGRPTSASGLEVIEVEDLEGAVAACEALVRDE